MQWLIHKGNISYSNYESANYTEFWKIVECIPGIKMQVLQSFLHAHLLGLIIYVVFIELLFISPGNLLPAPPDGGVASIIHWAKWTGMNI